MSGDKLKQNHVFVKNNVGSLALHKAKQEIGGIKMGKKEFIKETVDELLELKNNWKKQGALEELNDEKCFLKTTKRFNAKKRIENSEKQQILRGAR